MYRSLLEKVESFYFFGIYFGLRLNWREYIRQVENKCKNVNEIYRQREYSLWISSKSALTAPDMIQAQALCTWTVLSSQNLTG